MQTYRTFTWKDSNFRISCPRFDLVTQEIINQRARLEEYIARHSGFRTSFVPVRLQDAPPLIVSRMHAASVRVGVGPMAAVAGTMAQLAAEAALRAGAGEAIVENGGDIYLAASRDVTVGLYSGDTALGSRLAFSLSAESLPLAVCSSSSRMGHSTSLGDCDLATVVAHDAAIADAAATLACNLVCQPEDVDAVLQRVGSIAGVLGVLLVKGDRVGLVGQLPELVPNADAGRDAKVTRDRRS